MIKGLPENSKRRVAAYCRVSTDNIAQESSFESQVTYYTNWWDSTISGMLENEKYYGDVLLQKIITVDFLNHKRKANKGQAQSIWSMITTSRSYPKRYLIRFRMRENEGPYSRGIWWVEKTHFSFLYPQGTWRR